MPLSIANKPQLTGIIILFTGVALLAFTFVNAFLFLQEPLGLIATGDLARVFGEALAPLIQACIRLMYMGIMGWIGSLLTVRGIPLVLHKYTPAVPIAPTPQAQPQPETGKRPQPTVKPAVKSTQMQAETSKKPDTPLIPEPKQEEPKAVLIPPEDQREA